MICRNGQRQGRRFGVSIIETALVMGVFLLFLFGVLEYCRFVFYLQLATNAAREGARYAVVNTNDTNLVSDTQNVVTNYMAGQNSQIPITTTVYLSDVNGNNIGSATNAAFGQFIAVQVNCTYVPIVGGLVKMGSTPIQTRILMCSEAN
jgi:Flp pilus assembly protein TadG